MISRTLKRGDTGDDVVELQNILRAQGLEHVPATGEMDDETIALVELFQAQHIDQNGDQLATDGQVGRFTRWALYNPSGHSQKNGLQGPRDRELTPARFELLRLLRIEHAKPVFEKPDGSNRSEDIDRYWGDTGLRGLAWCCAFTSTMLGRAATAVQMPPEKFKVGGRHHVGVQRMYADALSRGLLVVEPKPGDVFVQLLGGGLGHTGFVVGVSRDSQIIYTCEGNAGNRVKMGRRNRGTIHYYIDAIRDGQGTDFTRLENLSASTGGESTR